MKAALGAATLSVAAGPAGAQGPAIELPHGMDGPSSTASEGHGAPDIVTRGMQEQRIASDTPLGGYGELHLNMDWSDSDDPDASVDLHRLVVFLSHGFSKDLRLYTETEVEHTLVGDGKPGEIGVEQAFVDYRLLDESAAIGEMALRAGIVLVPMGIINQWHEPPIFHGVERPMVDKVIIPTTWREAGLGLIGRPAPTVRYEVYVMSGLNAGAFRASDGIRAGRQKVAQARTDGVAFAGRVEVEPTSAVVVGAAGYAGRAGGNLTGAFKADGSAADLDVWVTGGALDARGRLAGLEARLLLVALTIGDTAALRNLVDDAGAPLGIDVGSRLLGGYLEVAYDVLSLLGSTQQFLPFVRFEYVDTLSSIEGRARTAADDDAQHTDVVGGLSWRPHPQVVFKGNVIRRSYGGGKDPQTLADAGVGFMF